MNNSYGLLFFFYSLFSFLPLHDIKMENNKTISCFVIAYCYIV